MDTCLDENQPSSSGASESTRRITVDGESNRDESFKSNGHHRARADNRQNWRICEIDEKKNRLQSIYNLRFTCMRQQTSLKIQLSPKMQQPEKKGRRNHRKNRSRGWRTTKTQNRRSKRSGRTPQKSRRKRCWRSATSRKQSRWSWCWTSHCFPETEPADHRWKMCDAGDKTLVRKTLKISILCERFNLGTKKIERKILSLKERNLFV